MRRPIMYVAGLLLATGASLALAGPASAAPSHHCHQADLWSSTYSDENSYSWEYNNQNLQNNGSAYNGLVLLSGNSSNGGGLLGLL